eukprot:jgi/Botrbrau1/1678/Bobra.116_2s0022.1
MWLEALDPAKFIDTFCDAQTIEEHGWGELGRFTPCFTDLVVLGLAHITAIILVSVRIAMLLSRRQGPKFRLTKSARVVKITAVAASTGTLLVVLFQLNARIALDPSPLVKGKVAPFEWAGYAVSIVSWAAFVAVNAIELNCYILSRTWLVRFPIILIFAGELAKLRFIIQQAEVYGYFFYLYIVYVGLEGWLALLALFSYPTAACLEPLDGEVDAHYVALATGEAAQGDLCPECTANIFSFTTFSWISPLLSKGYRQPLQVEDIWELPPGDRVEEGLPQFESAWQQHRKKPPLAWCAAPPGRDLSMDSSVSKSSDSNSSNLKNLRLIYPLTSNLRQ